MACSQTLILHYEWYISAKSLEKKIGLRAHDDSRRPPRCLAASIYRPRY
jgi:hypothetical protein